MDILNLDKPLRTSEAMVQVQPDLKAGVYLVELVVLDEAGEQSSVQISFEIQGRVIRPGPVTPPVITPVNPSIFTEVIKPVSPLTPLRPIKPKKPTDPTQ